MTEPDLIPFVNAQAQVYSRIVEELSDGRNRTHWIWFIFSAACGSGTPLRRSVIPAVGIAIGTKILQLFQSAATSPLPSKAPPRGTGGLFFWGLRCHTMESAVALDSF